MYNFLNSLKKQQQQAFCDSVEMKVKELPFKNETTSQL